jgi:hypothetical protein
VGKIRLVQSPWVNHRGTLLQHPQIAGYSRQKPGIRLMFRSGGDFGEPAPLAAPQLILGVAW